jgi:8-oxo-dGTP diphosphatase
MVKPYGLTMRGILKKNNKILLLKRHPKSKTGSCQWELPGGKVEKEEFFDQALIREFKEETNLNVKLGEFYDAIQQDFSKKRTVQLIMYVIAENYNIKISNEHVDYLWIDLEEIKNLNITEGLRKVLEKNNWKI